MSITHALSNALSGLTAAGRGAQVVSSNVANALTPGYGRRVLAVSSQSIAGLGAGVQVDGVLRQVSTALLGDRWLSDAALGAAGQEARFYAGLEAAIGAPDSAGALSARYANFEAALVAASSDPGSEARLAAVLDTAGALAGKIGAISDGIQALRLQADAAIDDQVTVLNDRLNKVAVLNRDISQALGAGQDATALMDQRQAMIDEIAGIVPLRAMPREGGALALYTTSGATLLDGTAATFGFSPAAVIQPGMTLENGALSGLTLNGQPVETAGAQAPVAGGSLAALFDQRDRLGPQAQADIDALAADLVTRFQEVGLDPSLADGAPGLFTDAGAALTADATPGLSARLTLNPAVDPDQGGALWRLRSGLGTAAPGPAGDSTLLDGFITALATPLDPGIGRLSGRAQGAAGLAAEILSLAGAARQGAETELGFALSRNDSLRAAELAEGVDTDQEMQTLLLYEQAYSANARVIETVDEMMQTLLRM